MRITRRDALKGATAAAVVTGAISIPLAIKVAGVKAALGGGPLIVLGRQWAEAYDNWQAAPREGESDEETKAMESHADDLGEIAWDLQAEIAKVPAFSIEGILIKLRIVGTDRQLMDQNNSGEWTDTYAQLTWQAWDDLERLAGGARS